MFTGIVQELAEVVAIEDRDGLRLLHLGLSQARCRGLESGASVAVNGTCLTVARQDASGVGFDVIRETLEMTNIGGLSVGDLVNVERSATFADEIGGHRVSGHVSGVARVVEREVSENNCRVRLSLPQTCADFVFYKGFVALDGASLTISGLDRSAGWLEVSLIPETLARTTFGFKLEDALINIEVDAETVAVVETVRRVLADPEWRQRLA